jgi:hypothetical protein
MQSSERNCNVLHFRLDIICDLAQMGMASFFLVSLTRKKIEWTAGNSSKEKKYYFFKLL